MHGKEGMKVNLMVHRNWLGVKWWRAALGHGRAWPYRHGDGENPKLKLGRARFKAGWGRAARGLNDEAVGALNRIEVNSP